MGGRDIIHDGEIDRYFNNWVCRLNKEIDCLKKGYNKFGQVFRRPRSGDELVSLMRLNGYVISDAEGFKQIYWG